MSINIAKANLSVEGIIHLTFLREDITLDVNEVIAGWEMAHALSPDKKVPVLLMTGRWTLLEKEARDFVMQELQTWPAVAIVIDNMGQRVMGQVVINMTGKGNKIKLFDGEQKAKEWLVSKMTK